MTQQQLEYFLELAHTLNFTKVSQHFMISQTAVSKQIQNLEDEVGVQLFNRTSRQVELTNAGRTLMSDAPFILANMYSAVTKLQKAATGYTETLNIGYSKGLENTEFHDSIRKFSNDNHQVCISFLRLNEFDLYTALDKREIDIAFCQQYKTRDASYNRTPLFSVPIVCIMTDTHPLASRKNISFKDLENEQLIITSSSVTSNISLDEYLSTHNNADLDTMTKHPSFRMDLIPFFPSDFYPKKIFWTNDIESGILMASVGMGIVPAPAYALSPFSNKKLAAVPLENSNKIFHIQAVYRKDNTNKTLKNFLPFIK